MTYKLTLTLPAVLLAACGSSNGPTTYQPSIPDDIAFTVTDTEITVAQGGTTTVLARDANFDRGDFVAARSGEGTGFGPLLAINDTGNTVAALLLDDSVTPYVARTTAFEQPSGSASLSGTYVGSLSEGSSYITGDTTLNVSFDDMTLDGEVTKRTVVLEGLPFDLVLSQDTLTLLPTDISSTGSFTGAIDTDALVADDPDFEVPDTAEFEGLVGGSADGVEAVGIIRLGDEIGVFSAAE